MADFSSLPADWWTQPYTLTALSKWFRKHILQLHVGVQVPEHPLQHLICTGFLVRHRDHLFWVTAGHVLEEDLLPILSGPSSRIAFMYFVDGFRGPEARVHVDRATMEGMKSLGDTADVGYIPLREYYSTLLLANPDLQVLDARIWHHRPPPQTREGFYLIGTPKQWVEPATVGPSGQRSSTALTIVTPTLPVKWIPDLGEALAVDSFWGAEGAFYGRLLPAPGQAYDNVDIKGMSGGLVLSIDREGENIRYRLYGIQSSWLPSCRSIKAVDPFWLEASLDVWLDEQAGNPDASPA